MCVCVCKENWANTRGPAHSRLLRCYLSQTAHKLSSTHTPTIQSTRTATQSTAQSGPIEHRASPSWAEQLSNWTLCAIEPRFTNNLILHHSFNWIHEISFLWTSAALDNWIGGLSFGWGFEWNGSPWITTLICTRLAMLNFCRITRCYFLS